MKRLRFLCVMTLSLACVQASTAETTFFGPVRPYLSAADAPDDFYSIDCGNCISFLEDFEDGSLDGGIVITGFDVQVIGPDFRIGDVAATDSVDGDDGVFDGEGHQGHAFYSPGNVLTITFEAPVTSAGFVWTDGDRGSSTQVEFIGRNGTLGTIGPRFLADSGFQGSTGEDGFFGARSVDGIVSIIVRNIGGSGIEIDHVQFETVPEPNATALLVFGVVFIANRLRKR